MADFMIERRGRGAYIALPVEASLDALPTVVAAAYAEVHAYLDMRGAVTQGAGLIRYREQRPDGVVVLEVGSLVLNTPRVRDRYVIDYLAEGIYAVAKQRGPYAWIGGLTRELTEWILAQGLDPAGDIGGAQDISTTAGIDALGGSDSTWSVQSSPSLSAQWDCHYDFFPDVPVEGAHGLEGTVHVCILLGS